MQRHKTSMEKFIMKYKSLSENAKEIAKQNNSSSVVIIQKTGDSFSDLKIGFSGSSLDVLTSSVMSVYNTLDFMTEKGWIKQLDNVLDKDVLKCLLKLSELVQKDWTPKQVNRNYNKQLRSEANKYGNT